MRRGERVAIVGSREYADRERVRATVWNLSSGTVVISGGARGVDSWVEAAVQEHNESCPRLALHMKVIPPDYEQHGKVAPLVRNGQIAEECDRMIAHWDGKSRGTLDAITKAVKLGKPVEIVPDTAPVRRGG